MRVLIVDDIPEVLKQLRKEFEHQVSPLGERYSVDTCQNFDEALQIVRSATYDVVITDMRWQQGGEGGVVDEEAGIAVVHALADKSAITIVLTGYPSYENCVEAIRAGAWDYIPKTEDEQDAYEMLFRSITKACQYRSGSRGRGKANPDDAWVKANLDELLQSYPGKHVAVLYEKVVDSDESYEELVNRLSKKYRLVRPTVVSVPKSGVTQGEI
jgi:DNA-binding NtrC family response regulator